MTGQQIEIKAQDRRLRRTDDPCRRDDGYGISMAMKAMSKDHIVYIYSIIYIYINSIIYIYIYINSIIYIYIYI